MSRRTPKQIPDDQPSNGEESTGAGAVVLVADPASLPVLTVLVHPGHDPAAPDALRVLRTSARIAPWVPITGKAINGEPDRLHTGVVGWRVQPLAEIAALLNGEVR